MPCNPSPPPRAAAVPSGARRHRARRAPRRPLRLRQTPPLPPMFAPAPHGVALISGFEFSAQLPDGRWLTMRQGRNWAELGWIGRAALIIAAALAALSLLALMFARQMAKPIQISLTPCKRSASIRNRRRWWRRGRANCAAPRAR